MLRYNTRTRNQILPSFLRIYHTCEALSVDFDLVSIQDLMVVARAYVQLFLKHESLVRGKILVDRARTLGWLGYSCGAALPFPSCFC